jgi:hypothetical protein
MVIADVPNSLPFAYFPMTQETYLRNHFTQL